MAAVVDFDFEVPQSCEAHEPPEARGLARDDVRLMVATRSNGKLVHARFHELPRFLRAGDLLVVNTSSPTPAAVAATPAATARRSSCGSRRRRRDGRWLVELRTSAPSASRGGRGGRAARAADGAHAELARAASPDSRAALARGAATCRSRSTGYLADHGRPIRYGYVPRQWPLDAYQNVYALEPGSAEMPSAGRPFTRELVTRLVATRRPRRADHAAHGRLLARARRAAVPRAVPRARAHRARSSTPCTAGAAASIAVGTTVVRALETVLAGRHGRAGEGWTRLVITPERGVRAVDGLITGWHEPRASHLDLLEAAAGEQLLERSYLAALEHGYLWHEFGDSQLILP